MTNLDEKIKERQKQAIDRKIADKATLIANTLGKCEYKSWNEQRTDYEEQKGTFHDENFHITTEFNSVSGYGSDGAYGGASHKIAILYKEKKVFEATGRWSAEDIKTYLPGAWEKDLGSLNTAAKETDAEKRREAAAEQDKNKTGTGRRQKSQGSPR